MNNLTGFGIFGDLSRPPIIAAEERRETVQKKKNPPSIYESKYKMPKKFLFDSFPPIYCEEERDFTKKEAMEWLTKKTGLNLFSEQASSFNLEKSGDNYLIRPVPSTIVEKGSSGKQLLLQSLLNLEEILEPNDTGEITCEDVKKYIKDNCGINVNLNLVGSTYIPVPCDISTGNLANLKFPVNVSALSLYGEMLEITEQDYISFLPSDNIQDKNNISDSVIRKVLLAFFPDYSTDLQYSVNEENNSLYIFHEYKKQQASSSAKKEEMYPTTATVSLIFTQIELSPDYFRGASEVTKKEILHYIGKDYPEYSMERTELQYDKKKNMIIPILKSGKRGYSESYSLTENKVYRIESSRLMNILVLKDYPTAMGCSAGGVVFNLPKIPFTILKQVIYFFWDVFTYHHTEAIAQIFFNKETCEFQIHVPEQEVTGTSIKFTRNTELELSGENILVMEIHSHGFYQAVWSPTDNAEELQHCLYAVIGDLPNFRYDKNHIRVRGATGGYFVEVNADKIFQFPKSEEEFNKFLVNVKNIQ